MPEVFIAYAREDELFARRLHDALSSAGREPVWDQDHAAVPFSSPWRQAIREAIQNSEKFIYIISPESLASEPCANELAQALEFSKQVIPILRRSPTEGQTVPKTIEELNWILFSDDSEFNRSFKQLSGVLDTDLAWAKSHTRLLSRAAQWASSRDRSLLLRGNELRAAEAWLGEAAEHKKTPPTRIQRDYILRSRQTADHAARRSRGALAAGLVVAMALAAIALVQRGQAIRERNQAIGEARVATSGQLAARSEALDTADPTTASLLSAAAWQISPTAQARESMLDALAQPERQVFPVSEHYGVHSLAFSPDGKTLATGTFGGQVRLWSVTDGRPIGAPLPGRTGDNGDTPALGFSPNGKLLAAASQGLVRLWDVATHHQIGQSLDATISHDSAISGIAFSPNGKLLAVSIMDFSVFANSRIVLWNVATQRRVGVPLMPGGGSVAFSPDGQVLAATSYDNSTHLWDVATRRQVGEPLATANPGNGLGSVAFSPNGRVLATASPDGTVRLWDLATHRQIGAVIKAGRQAGLGSLAFSPDGETLATNDALGDVRLWNVATQQETGQPIVSSATCDGGISSLAFAPVTNFLATAGCDGTVRLWDVGLYHEVDAIESHKEFPLSAPQLIFSPDGKALITSDVNVMCWNISTHHLIAVFHPKRIRLPVKGQARQGGPFFDSPTSISASKDWKILATASSYGIQLWNMATHRQIGGTLPSGISGGPQFGPEVAVSPDATMVATVTGNHGDAQLWSVAINRHSGPPFTAAVNLGNHVGSVEFSPDGKIVATVNRNNGQIRLWSVATRRQVGAPFAAGTDTISFSPDGNILAVDDGNSVRFWNVATHRTSGAPVVTSRSNSVATAFSPGGTILATATDQGQIQLWDMATRRQIGPALTRSNPYSPYVSLLGPAIPTFSPDGKTLAIEDSTGVSFWDVAFPRELLRPVCAIAGRPMTHEQWNAYIPAQPFESICAPK